MLHVYALVRRPATLPDAVGIAGARLRVVQVTETLDAVASETQAGGSAATEEAILAHARVVEQLAATAAAVLPMRFGGAVADDDELRRRLAPREQELAAALERVSGCVELGLRVLAAQRDAAPAASGREYMERRLGEVSEAQRVGRELHHSLAAHARESTCRILAKPDVLLSAAYLVPRGDEEAFRAAVSAADEARPELNLVCTGPWPPYSFVLVEAEAA